MQRQRWDMVCEHVDNFRQLRTWLTVRVTLDSICNTCNVFFLFLKSDLLTLAQQTPEEQPRHGTNIIYNFLQILMLKNTNSPEGRLSKDLQKTWPSINFFFKLNFRPSGNFRKCLKSKFVFKFYRGRWQLYMLVPDSHRFKGYHYQQLGMYTPDNPKLKCTLLKTCILIARTMDKQAIV